MLLLVWANQSQTLYGASLGRGNQSLYRWSRSHDQDGHHAHIKTLKNLLLWIQWTDLNEAWYVASGTLAHQSLFIHDIGLTLTYLTARSNIVT